MLKRNLFAYFLLFWCGAAASSSKVLLFTHAYNRPEFIHWQNRAFKKFLADDYEFVVFNDAEDSKAYKGIHKACNECKIQCIDIPQGIHRDANKETHHGRRACKRNSDVVDYSLEVLGFSHNGIVALFDSDLFLIKNFSILHYMKDCPVAGPMLSHPTVPDYPWVGLVFLNMPLLPNKKEISFRSGCNAKGVWHEPGGYVPYYAQQNDVAIKWIIPPHHFRSDLLQFQKKRNDLEMRWFFSQPKFVKLLEDMRKLASGNGIGRYPEFMAGGAFFHCQAGTNWNKTASGFYAKKNSLIKKFIAEILAN